MDVETQEKIIEKIKLDKAYINYHKIIDKNLPYKFAYLDEWMLKKSKKLMYETENIENNIIADYRVYKRGTLIKADFGVGLGSEMSQVHFAIVLNKFDNKKNNVLTVIPLTSKKSKYNLDLGILVIATLIDKLKAEMLKIGILEEHQKMQPNSESKIKKLNTLINYYRSNIKNTYACVSLITTISKTRILQPINEFDIIGREKCSNEIMDKIDNEILHRFTKKDLTEVKK